MVHSFKVFIKDCIMVFAWFLHKSEASMVGVCLNWDLTSKGPFWALNHFLGIFGGWDIWKTTWNFWSIINFQCTGCWLLRQLPCSILGISQSRFQQIIINWIFLKSTRKGLLENAQDGISRPPGSRENQ